MTRPTDTAGLLNPLRAFCTGYSPLTIADGKALLAAIERQQADSAKRIAEFRERALEARLARLNWQKYNSEQGDEIVYQAEKMASAIDRIDATLNPAQAEEMRADDELERHRELDEWSEKDQT